jgi:hypothetical protein
MQEIEVDPVGPETLQAPLARGDGAGVCGVLRQHLGDDKALIAASLDGLRHDHLGLAIELGRVDQRHAEIEPELQRRDLLFSPPRALAHAPSALAELRVTVGRLNAGMEA